MGAMVKRDMRDDGRGFRGQIRHQGSKSRPSRVSWLRWGEFGLGGLLGLELFEGVECLVESESGCPG